MALGDLTTTEGVDGLISTAGETVDVLVNNVGGTAGSPKPGFLQIDDDAWVATFAFNLLSAVRPTRAVLPGMVARGRGSIVNVSSVNAHVPFVGMNDYGVAKAALTNLTKGLSEEFAPQGVRVNAVSPGQVRTPLWTDEGGGLDSFAAATGKTREEVATEVIPAVMRLSIARMAEPEEVASVVAFLASDEASYVTGAEWVVDGGFLKHA